VSNEDLSEERQKQILDAAITGFARNGFHAARMEDIARVRPEQRRPSTSIIKSKDAIITALLRTLFSWELRGARHYGRRGRRRRPSAGDHAHVRGRS
jgi:hypothetical protein